MQSKKQAQRLGFAVGEQIIYPAHGVGVIDAVEEQEIAGLTMELVVISFAQDRLTLRLPVAKIKSAGLRKLSEPPVVQQALDVLIGRARTKKALWSRRAQEFDAKINSGDLLQVAEVVRDLYRVDTVEQSYSERQLYETALDRMVREISAANKITISEATRLIDKHLAKAPRRLSVVDAGDQDADAA